MAEQNNMSLKSPKFSNVHLFGERQRVQHRHGADGHQAERDPLRRVEDALPILVKRDIEAAEVRVALDDRFDFPRKDHLVDHQKRGAPQRNKYPAREKEGSDHVTHLAVEDKRLSAAGM